MNLGYKGKILNLINNSISSTLNIEELFEKKILITGATGLIGSYIVDMLRVLNATKSANIEIFALGRSREKLSDRFMNSEEDSLLHFVVQDVIEPINLDIELNYIIHAAGDGYPEAFRVRPVETMTPSLLGTYNVLEYARRRLKGRFLFISSGESYGRNEGSANPLVESDCGKLDSMDVRSCYPMAKRCAETLCVSYAYEYGIDVLVVRSGHVYGARTNAYDNRATAQFLRKALKGEDIVLLSSGSQIRSYTYIPDTASAILTVMVNGETCRAYNIANSCSRISISEFAHKLAEVAGVGCVYQNPDEIHAKELSPFNHAILDSSALEALGWKGKYSPEEGIKCMYEVARELDQF